jgi:hypothetical protein
MVRGVVSRSASRAVHTGRQLLVDWRPLESNARPAPAEAPKVAVGFAGVNEPDPAEIANLSQARRMPESTVCDSTDNPPKW